MSRGTFSEKLRGLAQRHMLVEPQEDHALSNRIIVEDPVMFLMKPDGLTVAVEFPTIDLPLAGNVVEVRLFGGKCLMVVKGADYGVSEGQEHIMFIVGTLLNV